MKIIERYLSAYVIDCLFGHVDDTHMEYVYQVLRESGSRSDHPVLGKVLDYVRQGDPADPKLQAEVRAYTISVIQNGVALPAPEFEASYHIENKIMSIMLFHKGEVAGFGVAHEAEKEQAFKELEAMFPGIRIKQV